MFSYWETDRHIDRNRYILPTLLPQKPDESRQIQIPVDSFRRRGARASELQRRSRGAPRRVGLDLHFPLLGAGDDGGYGCSRRSIPSRDVNRKQSRLIVLDEELGGESRGEDAGFDFGRIETDGQIRMKLDFF